VPVSRSQGVDVITGEGLDQALTGVETIIDVATGPRPISGPRRSSSPEIGRAAEAALLFTMDSSMSA
jgi:hypothetical protein